MKKFEVVTQLEVNHNIQKDSEALEKYILDLDLKNQVASEDTIKFLKAERSENNKRTAETKQTLKDFIDLVSPTIVKIKNDVKEKLIEPREKLDKDFKTKIALVEDKIKDEKKAELTSYFDECCLAAEIDFIKFDQVGFKINLTESVKNQQKVCEAFFTKISEELTFIDINAHSVEVLAEYKQTLNVINATKTVVDRKAREKAESDRLIMQAWSKRKNILLDLSVVFHPETETFEFNENIYVSKSACELANNEEFEKIIADLKQEIDKVLSVKNPVEKKPEPLKAPSVAPTNNTYTKFERIETSRFECKATLIKLKALGQYMKDNGIIYSNIKK